MDVLLRLIERDQLTVTDVSLMAVTDQFLSFLERLDDAPAATVAEFAAIGTYCWSRRMGAAIAGEAKVTTTQRGTRTAEIRIGVRVL